MALRDLFKSKKSTAVGNVDGNTPELPTNTDNPIRVGFWVLGVGFGGFLLWAALAPLDEGVPTAGMVTVDTKRKVVQHLSGGIIKAVHVKEGQFVKEGDPLIDLDPEYTQANFESVRQRYYTLRAMESRLRAENQNANSVSFHPDLVAAANEPHVAQAIAGQQSLFAARRSALQADLQAIEEAIRGSEAATVGYQDMLIARKAQQAHLQEELKGLRELVAEGYAPKNQLLTLERQAAETTAAMAEANANAERSRRSVAEMRMRKQLRQQEYRKEVETQLSDVGAQVNAESDKFTAAKSERARTIIRSPVDGQVVGLVAQSVGGVITAGQKIMDIVPAGETLVLETHVPPHMIDRVQPGNLADVRFSSFVNTPQIVVPGRIDSISTDLLTEPQTGVTYYLARVSVTPEGLKMLGKRQMQAGMPAEVIIVTGERSLLTYLARPLLKRMASSMKEE